jgi:hypothetical protein
VSTNEILDAFNSEVQRIAEIQASVHRLTEWALGEGATVRNDTHTPLQVHISWTDGLSIVVSIDIRGGRARVSAKYVLPGQSRGSLSLDSADEVAEFFKCSEVER